MRGVKVSPRGAFEHTLREAIEIGGRGLHTGAEARVRILPAGPGTGIVFVRHPERPEGPRRTSGRDSSAAWPPQNDEARRSRVWVDGQPVETVEHLLSALSVLGVSNARIEVEGQEIPALDGSAAGFARAVVKAGRLRQKRRREVYALREPVFVSGKEAAILAVPYNGLRVTYTLDYPHPLLKRMTVSFEVSEKTFLKEIAPARTFCTREEAAGLRAQGFGRGADYKNTLVMGPKGPVKNRLRFADECARHKVLDMIGDLGLLGFGLRAHFIAVRSGHGLNREIAKLILQQKERRS